jgi:hypothetical protein
VLRVNAQDHAALFFARQSLEIFLAQRFRKDFQPIEFEHAPLPVARFNERFEFALAAASSGARKLARGKSPGCDPYRHFLELVQPQKQTKRGHVGFIALVRVAIDVTIVPRLANHQPLHQRTRNQTGSARERSRFHGQIQWPQLGPSPQRFEFFAQSVRSGVKTHRRLIVSVIVHTAQHAVFVCRAQRGVKWSLSFHTIAL